MQKADKPQLPIIDVEHLRPRPTDDSILKHLELGHSPHGFVYRGEWTTTANRAPHPVAVKRYQLGSATASKDTLAELSSEAQRVRSLQHANIVNIVGVVLDPHAPCLVMETEPTSLGYILSVAFPSPPSNATDLFAWPLRLHLLAGVAAGMAALHSLSPPVFHGNLKASNVLVDAHGGARVTDFGVAALKAQSERCRTSADSSQSTDDGKTADAESRARLDVSAFGVLMYELLTGQRPFPQHDASDVQARLGKGQRPPLPDPVPNGCPAEYYELMQRCWSTAAAKRIDFTALQTALSKYLLTHGEAVELQRFFVSESFEAPNPVIEEEKSDTRSAKSHRKESIAATLVPKTMLEIPVPEGKLLPGESLHRMAMENPAHAVQWHPQEAKSFDVRCGPDYDRNKQKAPSKPALYDIFALDCFRSSTKIPHITSQVELPSVEAALLHAHRLHRDASGGSAPDPSPAELAATAKELSSFDVPPFLVINMAAPNYPAPNPVWGTFTGDGPSLSFVIYMVLSKYGRIAAKQKTAAGSLLQFFSANCAEKEVADRFKGICRVENMDIIPVARIARSYNGKPFLTRPQHQFFKGSNYLEVFVDVHHFAYLPRWAFHSYVAPILDQMIGDLAFVIEARQEEEMPEQILGAMRFRNLHYDRTHELESLLKHQGRNRSFSTLVQGPPS